MNEDIGKFVYHHSVQQTTKSSCLVRHDRAMDLQT